VEEAHSIGSVLNAGFSGRGAQYRQWWKRGAVLNAGSSVRLLLLKRDAVSVQY
jgi:hypothetical protein